MKTMLFVADARDALWARMHAAEGCVVALSASARHALGMAGIGYAPYGDKASAMLKEPQCDLARSLASRWHEHLAPELSRMLVPSAPDIAGAPPLALLFHSLTLRFFEAIQAHATMSMVLDAERPAHVLLGQVQDAQVGLYGLLTSPAGLEREALVALCRERGITCEEISQAPNGTGAGGPAAPARRSALHRVWGAPRAAVRRVLRPVPRTLEAVPSALGTGARALLATWGGAGMTRLEPLYGELLARGVKVALVVAAGRLGLRAWRRAEKRGAVVLRLEDVDAAGAPPRRGAWTDDDLERALLRDEGLMTFLYGEVGPTLAGMLVEQIAVEVAGALPQCLHGAARFGALCDVAAPDVVLHLFSTDPRGAAQTLAARARGIPTVTMGHGLHCATDAERDVFAAREFAACGRVHSAALVASQGAAPGRVPPLGDAYLDGLTPDATLAARLRCLRAGVGLRRPVCVVCDSGGWTQTRERRHTQWATLDAVAALAREMPQMQVVYRIHPGSYEMDYDSYFTSRGAPAVLYQRAGDLPLPDLMARADVVVSHMGSAVAEALLCGVPVVYLHALSRHEPSASGCPVIREAAALEDIIPLVRETLDARQSRQAVRRAAQPWLDEVLCGADGGAARRVADFLMSRARGISGGDASEWLGRQKASGRFSSLTWQKGLEWN